MYDTLLEQFEKLTIIKHNRDLFRLLGGLELEIFRTDGTPLKSTDSRKSRAHQDSHSSSDSQEAFLERMSTVCETRQPHFFLADNGYKKIIVPIVYEEEVVGVITTGENDNFQFKGNQCQEIMQIVAQFVSYVVKNELTPLNIQLFKGTSMSRQKELLSRAVKYIKNNFHSNNLTLKEVSSNNGISYHHLSRIFKKELNTTFAQFRNKVRLEAAVKLLHNTNLSVSQISYSCGYDDPAYFSKVFRSCFGVSPAHFRSKRVSSSRLVDKKLF